MSFLVSFPARAGGLEGSSGPSAPPGRPPEQSRARCTPELAGETPRSLSQAQLQDLPRPPALSLALLPRLPLRLHCLPGRERGRREDRPRPLPWVPLPWVCSLDSL